VYSEPLAEYRGAGPEDASSPAQRRDAQAGPRLGARYHEEHVQPPADKAAELVFLLGVIEEGESRGWKLGNAVEQPGDDVLLVVTGDS
jgi:hypothetical protein